MSKVKNAELEESALFISEKLLVEIETLIDKMDFTNITQVKNLRKLVMTYNQLKPYSW